MPRFEEMEELVDREQRIRESREATEAQLEQSRLRTAVGKREAWPKVSRSTDTSTLGYRGSRLPWEVSESAPKGLKRQFLWEWDNSEEEGREEVFQKYARKMAHSETYGYSSRDAAKKKLLEWLARSQHEED